MKVMVVAAAFVVGAKAQETAPIPTPPVSLAADDECAAVGGDAECAMSALQIRAGQKQNKTRVLSAVWAKHAVVARTMAKKIARSFGRFNGARRASGDGDEDMTCMKAQQIDGMCVPGDVQKTLSQLLERDGTLPSEAVWDTAVDATCKCHAKLSAEEQTCDLDYFYLPQICGKECNANAAYAVAKCVPTDTWDGLQAEETSPAVLQSFCGCKDTISKAAGCLHAEPGETSAQTVTKLDDACEPCLLSIAVFAEGPLMDECLSENSDYCSETCQPKFCKVLASCPATYDAKIAGDMKAEDYNELIQSIETVTGSCACK